MNQHDYFSFLAAHGGVAIDAIKAAAKNALAESTSAGLNPQSLPDEDKIAFITSMLSQLRQSDAVTLGVIIQVTEEFLDKESELTAPDSAWWQELFVPMSEFELYYNDIVSLLPEESPPAQSYLDVWQNDKKSHLEKKISRLSRELRIASEEDIAGDVGAIAEELQFCQKCAEDCGLLLSAEFLKIVQDICHLAIGHGVHLTEPELDRFEHSLLRCIDIIWEIRTFVSSGGDERQYWQNPVSRQNFLSVREKLAAISSMVAAAA